MQEIFAFTFNPETQEATFAGTMEPQVALQILQNIVFSEAIRLGGEAAKKAKKVSKPGKHLPSAEEG